LDVELRLLSPSIGQVDGSRSQWSTGEPKEEREGGGTDGYESVRTDEGYSTGGFELSEAEEDGVVVTFVVLLM
jgi:hypothetical protein